jgi:hypothetical protein
MARKEGTVYTVEREFLEKYSIEEMLIHIIKAHVREENAKKGQRSRR